MPPDKLTDATKWSSVNQWARNEPNVNDDGAIDLEAPSHKDVARRAENEIVEQPTQRKISSSAAMASPPAAEFSDYDYLPASAKMPAVESDELVQDEDVSPCNKQSYYPVWADNTRDEEAAATHQINEMDAKVRESSPSSSRVPREMLRPGAYCMGGSGRGDAGLNVEDSTHDSTVNLAAELVDVEAEKQNVDEQVKQGLQRVLAKAPIAEVVPKQCCDHRRTVIVVIVLAILSIGITLGVVIPKNQSLPPAPVPSEEEVIQTLSQVSADGGEALQKFGSPQQQALAWLLNDTFQGYYTDAKLIQRFALATVFYSTHGHAWQNNSMWLDNGDECGRWWQHVGGLTCDKETGAISGLDLNENDLSGQIPPEIGLLSALVTLQLKQSDFKGSSIPEEIGKLSLLEKLLIQSCSLSGTIPVTVANITTLKDLNLAGNDLSGPFVESIGKLSNIEGLHLYDNALNSSIPDVSKLTNLKQLNLRENKLTGSIPTEIGLLTVLSEVNLYLNQMAGKIPSEIGLVTKLSKINIRRNAFTGSIPNEMSLLSDLDSLFFYDNRFTGTIPSKFSELEKLESINLRSNRLTGMIPDLSRSTMLYEFTVNQNELTSTIPSSFSVLSNLEIFSLYDNKLTGTIPNLKSMTALKELRVHQNSLTGTLPTEVGLLVALTDLNVQDNLMKGDIPTEIYSLTNLLSLNIGNEFGGGNQFRGSIPTLVGHLTTLENLMMNNIKLFGSIPSNIGLLANLNVLWLQNNMLTGSIPDFFDEMRQLDDLHLYNNNLTGSFACPEWIRKCLISCDDPLYDGCRTLQ